MHGENDPIKAHGGFRDLKSFRMHEIILRCIGKIL